MATKDPKGVSKAAMFLLSLGPGASSKILKSLPESDIERVTLELANTSRVSSEDIETVMEEFNIMTQAHRFVIDGGLDYARDVLEKTLGPQKAAAIMKKFKDTSQVRPFTFVDKADPRQLINIISQEHPQTIALILSYLDPDQSAAVISALPEEEQSDIARRIAMMERASPDVIKEIEAVMRERLSTVVQHDFTAAGGAATVVEILNRVDRGTERTILEEMENEDPELAEEIRNMMFIFEDIITLDDSSIQRIIREVDNKDLALALKGSSEEVKQRVLKNVSKRAAELIKEEIDFMGPVRLREVEESQQKIVAIIRRLEEAGEIIIGRGGDDAIVQ